MKQKQKIIAFWRKQIVLRFKRAITSVYTLKWSIADVEIKTKILFIIPCLFVLLGVLFLSPKTAYLSQQIDTDTLIRLTNEERKRNGLNPLLYNETLAKAAEIKALDLLEDDYFGHNTPEGKDFVDWIKEAGYGYAYAGENLAMDFATSEGVMNGWMDSEKHCDNILGSNYEEIGIAVVAGEFNDKKTTMVVQIFGTRLERKISLIPYSLNIDSL